MAGRRLNVQLRKRIYVNLRNLWMKPQSGVSHGEAAAESL
jgi:hypothetical protein